MYRKRLADVAELVGSHTSDAKAEQLRDFILFYQSKHDGRTPPLDVMANELHTHEVAIRTLLGKLENRGKIHVISRSPPRIMVILPGTVLPHEPGVTRTPEDPTRYERFLSAEAMRQGLGRFIGEYEAAKGTGPSLRHMMDHLGSENAGWTHRMAEMLAQSGLIQFGHGLRTCLTEAGRSLYRIKTNTKEEEVMNTEPKARPRPIIVAAPSGGARVIKRRAKTVSPDERAHQAGKALAKYMNDHGGASPRFRELTVLIGLKETSMATIGRAVDRLAEQGYLHPRGRTQMKLRFTDSGASRFGYGTLIQPEPQPEPQSEKARVRRAWPETSLRLADTKYTPTPQAPCGDSPPTLAGYDTAMLVLELIERGYTVRKG